MLILNDYNELSATAEHVLKVTTMPCLHKDPFDRLLIAQARCEGMLLLTVDPMVIKYGDAVRVV